MGKSLEKKVDLYFVVWGGRMRSKGFLATRTYKILTASLVGSSNRKNVAEIVNPCSTYKSTMSIMLPANEFHWCPPLRKSVFGVDVRCLMRSWLEQLPERCLRSRLLKKARYEQEHDVWYAVWILATKR